MEHTSSKNLFQALAASALKKTRDEYRFTFERTFASGRTVKKEGSVSFVRAPMSICVIWRELGSKGWQERRSALEGPATENQIGLWLASLTARCALGPAVHVALLFGEAEFWDFGALETSVSASTAREFCYDNGEIRTRIRCDDSLQILEVIGEMSISTGSVRDVTTFTPIASSA
ncbi:MAG TPA: hypothetical protein VEH27_11265 [Methylomirabilota bacterium]|nr:hypothetical protein [Methylomirabilota bacterium]